MYPFRGRSPMSRWTIGVALPCAVFGCAQGVPTLAGDAAPMQTMVPIVEDTFLNLGTQNYVSEVQLNTYTLPADTVANTILIRFDLSVIPAGANILQARLFLYLVGWDPP